MNILDKINRGESYSKEELVSELERLYSLDNINLHHIAFNVGDVRKTVDFYTEKLDAEVLFCTDSRACITYNGAEICFTEGNKHPTHIAFEVESLDDMPKLGEVKRHSDDSSYIYLEDDYGNAIEWIYFE